jgi:hypothetical protein
LSAADSVLSSSLRSEPGRSAERDAATDVAVGVISLYLAAVLQITDAAGRIQTVA